ncbi:CoA ligase [Dactylonectria estremocensis]|uniref:CoA ligase n=1 Tax=Dactylonectria estremocensis TaxID=1079267 RepID=A0A9P9E6Z5_9HYPO|nr:CoA ligase [Dactylonectria estremocensis]
MIFKSQSPEINVPADQSLWYWLFESTKSAIWRNPQSEVQGFTDVITQESINYLDLRRHATFLSTALSIYHDIQPGDVVIVCGRNSIWYPVATLSAVRLGAIACGVSPEYTVDELAFSLRVSKAKAIFATEDTLSKAYAAALKVGLKKENVILTSGTSDSTPSIQSLLKKVQDPSNVQEASHYRIPEGKTNRDVCAFLCFSSGTTGLPKAVMLSHANIIAQCLQVEQITPADHNKILAALPFYHITGIVHQLHLPIVLNARVYVLSTFTMDLLLKTVAENKIKELLVVPPILIRLVREPKLVDKYDLSHVARFSSGAAPLSQEILTLLERKFPGTGFKQGYGMTESCSAITSHPPSKYAYKYADRVGMLVGSTEVRIVDPTSGTDCGIGQTGEIWARGPQVAMGYLNNQKATAETFDQDGFLHTGDIGKFDEEGLLSITDRMKEMIKVKGIGVAPAELEDLLLGHPLVNDAAVRGIPDDSAGERPKAYVVLEYSNSLPSVDAGRQLIQFVKSKKARHKWIVEVDIVAKIPKSASGKILRKNLRQLVVIASIRDERQRVKL